MVYARTSIFAAQAAASTVRVSSPAVRPTSRSENAQRLQLTMMVLRVVPSVSNASLRSLFGRAIRTGRIEPSRGSIDLCGSTLWTPSLLVSGAGIQSIPFACPTCQGMRRVGGASGR